MDPESRRAVFPWYRWHFAAARHADHADWLSRDALLLERHRAQAQGILRHAAAPANRHDRSVHVSRFFPLLRILGSGPGADVLPDRHLGRSAEALRSD